MSGWFSGLKLLDAPVAKVLPWVALFSTLCVLWAAYVVLQSPADYLHGQNVRIMYVHVPAAWWALATYASIAVCSATLLVTRAPSADLVARALTLPGAACAFICLATGALWGRPAWGTWWVWDARLTSMLVLFVMYVALLIVRRSETDSHRAAQLCAYVALLGALDLPIIHYSVQWWNTLHQPPSISLTKSSIDIALLRPLLHMAAAFASLMLLVVLLRLRVLVLRQRLQRRQYRRLQQTQLEA